MAATPLLHAACQPGRGRFRSTFGCGRGPAPAPLATVLRNWVVVREMPTGGSLLLVLERDLDLRAVGDGLAFLDLHVELLDLGDAQIAERAPGALDGGGRRLLPRLRAGSDELDDLVHALGHGGPPLSRRLRSLLRLAAEPYRGARDRHA